MSHSRLAARLKAGAAATAIAGLLAARSAPAEDNSLYLDVTVNGQRQELIGGFVKRGDTLYATPDELRAIGVRPPDGTAGDRLVRLSDIAGLHYDYDEPTQALRITLPESERQPVMIGVGTTRAAQASSDYGLLLDYDLIGTRTDGGTSGTGLLEGRVFGPLGVLDASVIGTVGNNGGYGHNSNDAGYGPDSNNAWDAPGGGDRLIRLDTTATYSDPDALQRVRLGDFISGGVAWSRPVRMAGGQVDRDFTMRPDLVTFPVPAFSGDAAVPSTVDIYIDNVKQFSSEVKPGPFQIANLPVMTGGGDAQVVVRDMLGRETVQTLPFYASRSLLREGLTDYSFEAGSIRLRYGEVSADYSGFAGVGSLRYGLDDTLTLEGHFEGSQDLILGGAGAVYAVGTLGTVNASLAASHAGAESGLQYSVGCEHLEPRWNLSLQRTGTSGPYNDLAAVEDHARQRGATQATVSLNLDRVGTFSLGYVDVDRTDFGRFQIASVNYVVAMREDVQLMATGFRDLTHHDNVGVMLSLSVTLGTTASAALDANAQGHQHWLTERYNWVQDTGVTDRGLVVNAQISEGDLRRQYSEVDYRTSLADFAVAADRIDNATSVRGEMRGTIAAADGGVFFGQRVYDGFAVVDTGVPGVGVTLENRPAGRTDSDGQLLVRGLRAYEPNQMAIDVTDLPADAAFADTRRSVSPANRSGVVVRFPVHVGDAATILLHRPDGSAVPPGATLALDGAEPKPLPVGYDGVAYATGLKPNNTGTVTLPDGGQCRTAFAFTPVAGKIPQIGPVICGDMP
jgi:outer membrane usher protein